MANPAEIIEQSGVTEITARSIPQVFMNPEVRMAINDGHFQILTKDETACGILIRFKTAEEMREL